MTTELMKQGVKNGTIFLAQRTDALIIENEKNIDALRQLKGALRVLNERAEKTENRAEISDIITHLIEILKIISKKDSGAEEMWDKLCDTIGFKP